MAQIIHIAATPGRARTVHGIADMYGQSPSSIPTPMHLDMHQQLTLEDRETVNDILTREYTGGRLSKERFDGLRAIYAALGHGLDMSYRKWDRSLWNVMQIAPKKLWPYFRMNGEPLQWLAFLDTTVSLETVMQRLKDHRIPSMGCNPLHHDCIAPEDRGVFVKVSDVPQAIRILHEIKDAHLVTG